MMLPTPRLQASQCTHGTCECSMSADFEPSVLACAHGLLS